VQVPSADTERLGTVAREHDLYVAVGVNELAGGTLYNALLVFAPDGTLALHHRKLMPTNHERLVWGLGDGRGLETIQTDFGAVGGLICWENFMPLARAALYEAGVEVYLAPTADDTENWLESVRHIARESRAFVLSCCVFQRASSYPDDVPLGEGDDLLGRGGSAIIAPDGSYLAGPLWDEEGILFADLDPQRLYEERQRFDPAGHYARPDVLRLTVQPISRATPKPE
jgi:nitrilase